MAVPQAAALPVGAGPVPITFDLKDSNGNWFDSGLDLFGGESLAVGVLPRAGIPSVGGPGAVPDLGGVTGGLPDVGGVTGGLPDVGGVTGGLPDVGGVTGGLPDVGGLTGGLTGGLAGAEKQGAGGLSTERQTSGGTDAEGLAAGVPGIGGLTTAEAQNLTNADLTDSLTGLVSGATKSAPLLGETGVNLSDMLNLDSTLSAVTSIAQSNDEAAPAAAKAEALLGQFAEQTADLPVDAPINLDSLPVGVDLQKALDDLTTFAQKGPAITANFKIAGPDNESVHDITSLIRPKGAPMFEQPGAFMGEASTQLTEPGLYAWTCTIHPYMLGAAVVDDPLTLGLDFGKELEVTSRGLSVPSSADVIQQLVRSFFTITVPDNWQEFSYTKSSSWNPQFPVAPILQYDENGDQVLIPNLDAYYDQKFNYPRELPALSPPKTPGVGEVWIDTQMEEYAGKDKVGAATKIDVENWKVARKISGSAINMNNPHNMWTDKNYKYLYQTEWFDDELSVFERETGKHVRTVKVGPDPSHVMTRTDTDQVQVAINGGTDVVELSPGATKIDRRIPVGPQSSNAMPQHPHAFWLSHDGKTTVTPNVNPYDASVVDNETGTWRKEPTGELPIATGMTPDSSKFYMADFLGASISCVSLADDACVKDGEKVHNSSIDLWENYDPVAGHGGGPWGGLTIQLPVSPDGKAMLAANTFSGTVSVVDPTTDKVVKDLPCNAGCHGINFGAKEGGGYYAYVSNKFSNAAQVIDIDPNMDGDISDAAIAGQLVLNQQAGTAMEDTLTGADGMGGQGVLPVPLVYNGWSQQVPAGWREKLTCEQLNPIDPDAC